MCQYGSAVVLQTQCQDLRKRKNLELQILSEPVRGWEGDSMKSLGSVAYMSTVHTQSGTSEVRHREVTASGMLQFAGRMQTGGGGGQNSFERGGEFEKLQELNM